MVVIVSCGLDSIAISVFVLIFVDLDIYKQACFLWSNLTCCLFNSSSVKPS